MEEQSLQETGSDVKSEDPDVAEAGDLRDSDDLTKPEDESRAEETEAQAQTGVVDEETGQVAGEEDEDNLQNPEEDVEASVADDAPGTENDFQNENEEHEPEDQEEETKSVKEEDDQRPCTADLQENLEVVSDDEQKLLQELQTEHEKLSQLNHQLQSKLSEYFLLKSRTERHFLHGEVFTKEECLQRYPVILEKVKKEMEHKKQKQLEQPHVDGLHRQNDAKLEQIEREQSKLASTEREMLVTFLEQAMGKTEAQAEAERLLTAARECEDEYVSVRQESFKMNSKVVKLEAGLHARERALDGDMHKIDFEQLQIENETYKDKLEECKEDLIKLKKMIPHNDQILMHFKEKLRFNQGVNQTKRARFDELDALVLREHQTLTQIMQARDVLRFDNLHKRQDCGLLGNPTLLRDLEDTEDEREALERQVEMLKRS
ncbi:coiled-coil domain-containing protein 96 [Clarias magur]|uniref:Coiled-coil domain-containing protein 96 n=1 Tax=Clarias magur TaxID=1594786 RepID=A0A8J4TZZ2_CLAMG|nr:coiled-coil domain-containing protein 96 [Clarias magur]